MPPKYALPISVFKSDSDTSKGEENSKKSGQKKNSTEHDPKKRSQKKEKYCYKTF